jgi:hypothetical protein
MSLFQDVRAAISPTNRKAQEKRRLERILRDQGVPRTTARTIVSMYFEDRPARVGLEPSYEVK